MHGRRNFIKIKEKSVFRYYLTRKKKVRLNLTINYLLWYIYPKFPVNYIKWNPMSF